MKNLSLFIIGAIILTISSPSYSSSEENQDLPEFMIERVVSAKEIGALDYRLETLKEDFQAGISSMPQTDDLVEGKIQAAIINMVDDLLAKAEKDLDGITFLDIETRNALDEISSTLDEAEEIIKTMN